jgi:hypothetical protein
MQVTVEKQPWVVRLRDPDDPEDAAHGGLEETTRVSE